jgi:biopolymer transport protein ExbD
VGLKKRSKVSAQFNMSSLTDIIFLLLIFFMLTSSLVAPNALNLKLPGSSRDRVVSQNKIDQVMVSRQGRYYLNGRQHTLSELERELASRTRGVSGKVSVMIDSQNGTPVEAVVAVMDIALRYDINGILATD